MTNSTPTTRAERESLRLSADGTVRGRSGSETSAIILRMIADVDRMETELAEARRVIEGLVDYHIEHEVECQCRYRQFEDHLECTCGLDAAFVRAAEWLKGAMK